MRTVALGELGEIVSGATPKTGVPKYWNGEIPWVTPADLSAHDGIYYRGKPKRITQAGLESCSATMLPPNSILFSSRAPIGHCALSAFPVCTNQGFKNIVPNERLDPLYGYFALKFVTPDIIAKGRGATFGEVTKEIMEEVRIPYCDLAEQNRIAGLLDQADRLRRTRRYALELSDTFLPAAFLELFGDPVRNPKGWEKRLLGEISGIRRGASPRPIERFLGGSVPWIKIGDGTKGDQIYIASTEDHVTQEGAAKSVFLKKGALIFANCGVSCGFARILKIDGCIHDGWLAFSDFEAVLDPIFFLQAINQITLHLRSLAPEGTQPNLNTGIMSKFPIILPPLKLQQHFAGLVARHERSRTGQREALRQAEHLFQSLLHRAFTTDL